MSEPPREHYSLQLPSHQSAGDIDYLRRLEAYFATSPGSAVDKLKNFLKYVPRQALAQFLGRHEIFQRVIHVHGHVLECGVFLGNGLATWVQLSAIYEPYNHVRRIVGFDSFAGFPDLHDKDGPPSWSGKRPGGLATSGPEDVLGCLELLDRNRPLGHIPRAELVVGDARQTIPEYANQNSHLVVALLYLDFDLYEPTKVAIETFLPRMPQGAVIAFDQLDQETWPGETMALLESADISRLRIQRLPYVPQLSFAVLE